MYGTDLSPPAVPVCIPPSAKEVLLPAVPLCSHLLVPGGKRQGRFSSPFAGALPDSPNTNSDALPEGIRWNHPVTVPGSSRDATVAPPDRGAVFGERPRFLTRPPCWKVRGPTPEQEDWATETPRRLGLPPGDVPLRFASVMVQTPGERKPPKLAEVIPQYIAPGEARPTDAQRHAETSRGRAFVFLDTLRNICAFGGGG